MSGGMSDVTVLRRNRVLWSLVCLGLVVMLGSLGGAFAIGGLDAAPFPDAYRVVVHYVPGGLRTYGVILLLLAVSLLHGIAPRSRDDAWAVYTLALMTAVSSAYAVVFAITWPLTGVATWSYAIFWAFIALLAAACWRNPPTDGPGRVA